MKKRLLCTVLAYGCFFFFSCEPKSRQEFDLIITNTNLIDGTGSPIQESVNLYIKDGEIAAISHESLEAIGTTIDGTGTYVIPGLFDCHVHTTDFNVDFPKFIHYGVTSVFITGGSTCTNEYYADMRQRGNQDSIPAPRVFHTSQHFTMEGRHPVKTYSNSNWVEGKSVFYLKDTNQIKSLVREVAQYPIQGIKLTIEDGPAPPFVDRMPQDFIDVVVREAAGYGLDVFAHVSDNVEMLMAINAGVQNIIHFVGVDIDWDDAEHLEAVKSMGERKGSWVTTLMIDKSFIYPLHPEWLRNPKLQEVYSSEELEAMVNPESISRAEFMKGMIMNDYGLDTLHLINLFAFQIEDIKRIAEKGINMVVGTDTGNDFIFPGYSLHEEMQILEMGGIDQMTILKMATLNAATMLDAQDSLGSIEIGKKADLLLLNKNPLESISNALEIQKVIKNGKIQERID